MQQVHTFDRRRQSGDGGGGGGHIDYICRRTVFPSIRTEYIRARRRMPVIMCLVKTLCTWHAVGGVFYDCYERWRNKQLNGRA